MCICKWQINAPVCRSQYLCPRSPSVVIVNTGASKSTERKLRIGRYRTPRLRNTSQTVRRLAYCIIFSIIAAKNNFSRTHAFSQTRNLSLSLSPPLLSLSLPLSHASRTELLLAVDKQSGRGENVHIAIANLHKAFAVIRDYGLSIFDGRYFFFVYHTASSCEVEYYRRNSGGNNGFPCCVSRIDEATCVHAPNRCSVTLFHS